MNMRHLRRAPSVKAATNPLRVSQYGGGENFPCPCIFSMNTGFLHNAKIICELRNYSCRRVYSPIIPASIAAVPMPMVQPSVPWPVLSHRLRNFRLRPT
jgi:hypothetical protein